MQSFSTHLAQYIVFWGKCFVSPSPLSSTSFLAAAGICFLLKGSDRSAVHYMSSTKRETNKDSLEPGVAGDQKKKELEEE